MSRLIAVLVAAAVAFPVAALAGPGGACDHAHAAAKAGCCAAQAAERGDVRAERADLGRPECCEVGSSSVPPVSEVAVQPPSRGAPEPADAPPVAAASPLSTGAWPIALGAIAAVAGAAPLYLKIRNLRN